MRRLYFIRHAEAEKRERFRGDDAGRPLSEAGEKQARLIGESLSAGEAPPRAVFSSPAKRCMDTGRPLAEALGLELSRAAWLGEGSDLFETLGELRGHEEEVVAAVTHGDVLWAMLEWLSQGGVDLGPRPKAPKGSTWVLDWPDPSAEGVPLRAVLLPPPA